MTTYTAITNGEIDTDSPLTTGLMTKYRDNPIALAEGATGAPRIVRGAINPGVGHRWFFDYGDESDVAITHSASASIAPGLYQCTTFQIDATYTVDLSIPGPLVICATTSITINGTLDVDGQGGRGGLSSGLALGYVGQSGMFGGSGGSAYLAGRGEGGDTYLTKGATSAGGNGLAQTSRTKKTLLIQPPIFSTFYNMQGSDSNNNTAYLYQHDTSGSQNIGGGGGGSYDNASGGHGGGVVILCAPQITVGAAGVITADGTAGTTTNAGYGGGGAIIIATPSSGYTLTAGGSVAANGATNGGSGGSGGAGWVEEVVLT